MIRAALLLAAAASAPLAAQEADPRILAEYAQRLELLKSEHALENLQAAYGYYIDKGKWDEAARLFSADATYEWGQRGLYRGRPSIRRALELFGPKNLAPGQLNNYMMLQPIITVAPDNHTAKARWRSDVQLASNGKARWGDGVYENEYVNENGVWRISRLHYYVTFESDYDKGFVDGALPMEGPSATNPPDAPPTVVYTALPGGYLPPYHYSNPGQLPPPPQTAGSALADGPDATGEEGKLQALGRRLRALSDENDIGRLQRAYGYYVDKAQYRQVSNLFTEDGTLEIGGRGRFITRKSVFDYLNIGLGGDGFRPGGIANHQQFQGIVTVAPDGKTAKGRWTAFVMGGSVKGAPTQWGDVTYENLYEKVNGVWQIAYLDAPFNMYALYKDGWARASVPNTRPESWGQPPDRAPSRLYLTYPNFHNVPFHYPNPVTGKAPPPIHPNAGGMLPMPAHFPLSEDFQQ